MDPALTIFIMVLCLAAEAFFSGSEIGIVSADRMQLRHKAARGSRGARLALAMLEKPEWLLSTTLIGTNIAVVTNTTVATAMMIQLFGEGLAWLAIILVAPLIWIFGEIVAKSVFQQRADVLTPVVIFALRGASWLFFPILAVLSLLTRALARVLGGSENRNPFTLREEIVTMMEMSAAEGDIQPLERRMIRRVFHFSETTASDIMVPLIDVVAVSRGSRCQDALRTARQQAHKRLAVYDTRIDRLTGSVNALDLLGQDPDATIEEFVRPVHYVPGSIGIESLLSDFRKGSATMTVIVDEFGGTEGLVMLEDILEVIVGELEDEFDAPGTTSAALRRLGERHYLVGARITLDRIEDELGLEIPRGDYETLAGFLLHQAQAIPRPGTMIRQGDITFTVERASHEALQEIRIRW
jgi:putative hemolysin